MSDFKPGEVADIADPDWFYDNMADLYRSGWSIRRIAEACGKSYGGVRYNLLGQGVELRPQGTTVMASEQTRKRTPQAAIQTRKRVLEAVIEYADQQGRRPSQEELADRVGVSNKTLRRHLLWLEHDGLIRFDARRRPVAVREPEAAE